MVNNSGASGFFPTPDGKTIEIRDVWESNLEEEMANIREILEDYPYVAMVRVACCMSVPILSLFTFLTVLFTFVIVISLCSTYNF